MGDLRVSWGSWDEAENGKGSAGWKLPVPPPPQAAQNAPTQLSLLVLWDLGMKVLELPISGICESVVMEGTIHIGFRRGHFRHHCWAEKGAPLGWGGRGWVSPDSLWTPCWVPPFPL